jgi:hypothetical protein
VSLVFTVDDSPRMRAAVQEDLGRISEVLTGWAPGVGVALGGSFDRGEAVAWLREGRLQALSDYDLFVALPGPRPLARLAALRAGLAALGPRLHNPRVDCNLLLPGDAGWSDQGPLPALAGTPPRAGSPAPGGRLRFALHSLHAAQRGLLGAAPCLGLDATARRYQLNRCALAALRAAWNLEAPQPVHALLACGEPLAGAWGHGLEPPLRAFFGQALRENPGLGIAVAAPLTPDELGERWSLARRASTLLYERWHWQLALAAPDAARAVRRQRIRGRARLAWARLQAGRFPGLSADAHLGLLEARRALLEAALPTGGLDHAWLERGQRVLRGLGLAPRRWHPDPVEAFAEAGRIGLPNPLRVVVERP